MGCSGLIYRAHIRSKEFTIKKEQHIRSKEVAIEKEQHMRSKKVTIEKEQPSAVAVVMAFDWHQVEKPDDAWYL